jgi:ribosomal-protein-alanine N-acetyltransferase
MSATEERLRFRRIQSDDVDVLMPIEMEAYPEPWTPGMFRQEIYSPLSSFYVALLDDAIVGYVGFWRALDEAHITSVTIQKDYRRHGFGRQLMAFILETAMEQGLLRATLEVRPSNIRAQNLYLSMGFEQIGLRKRYYSKTNEDALIMARDLPLRKTERN